MDRARSVDTDQLRRDIDATRASISETVGELRQRVDATMHWQTYVERYPAQVLAGATLAGLVVGRRLARRLMPTARRDPGQGGTPGETPRETHALVPARVEPPGSDRATAGSASWQRLDARVEALVKRVIDEIADAAERALVPALVGGLQALFEGRRANDVRQRTDTNGGSVATATKGG